MADISVHALGRKAGKYAANKTFNPNQAELLGYGAEIILGSILKLAVLFSIATLLRVVYEVSILLFIIGLLRTLSGGAHCSAYYRCLVASVIIIISLGCMIKVMFPLFQGLPGLILLTGVLMVSIYLYCHYAPQAPLSKPLKSKAIEDKFRRLTILTALFLSIVSIIAGPGYLISWIIAFGLLWQAFTLTPFGHLLIKKLDILFSLNWKGGELNVKTHQ